MVKVRNNGKKECFRECISFILRCKKKRKEVIIIFKKIKRILKMVVLIIF